MFFILTDHDYDHDYDVNGTGARTQLEFCDCSSASTVCHSSVRDECKMCSSRSIRHPTPRTGEGGGDGGNEGGGECVEAMPSFERARSMRRRRSLLSLLLGVLARKRQRPTNIPL